MDPSTFSILGMAAGVLVLMSILLRRVINACSDLIIQGYSDHFTFELGDGTQSSQEELQVDLERQQGQECVLLAFYDMKATEILGRGARIAKFHGVGAHDMNPMWDTNQKVVGILTYVVGSTKSSTSNVKMDTNMPLYEGFEECSICLCSYEEGEELSQIQACRHHFHRECLHKWVVASIVSTTRWFTCPLCKACIL